jgi:hypothetical protein
MELPGSRPPLLADRFVLCRGHSDGGCGAAEALAQKNSSLGTVRRIHCLRSDDCNLSFWREMDKGQAGVDSP